MKNSKIKGIIEALIFACGEPISLEKIAQVLNMRISEAEKYVEELSGEYNVPERGIRLLNLNGSLQFCSNPDYIEPVREILDIKKNTPLSGAAMEVLSLVAYNQPVTKAYVEQVRGVDCSGVIGSLTQKGLIEEKGRLELPGRPLLYGTTDTFLRCFGISNISELPPLPKEENSGADEDSEENGEDL